MANIQILDANGATQTMATTLVAGVNTPWHIISDGTNAVTVTPRGSANTLTVQIVDASGNQITSFGGSDAADGTIGAAVGTTAIMVGAENSSGHVAFLNLDSSGNLKVVTSGSAGNAAASATGAAVPADADYIGFNVAGNLIGVSSSNPLPVTATGTVGATQSGTWTVQQGSAPWSVVGTLTHNNAAPTTNNVGALVAVASTAAPTYNAGDQVLLSTDLSGNLRVNAAFSGTLSNNITEWNTVALGSPTAWGSAPSGNVIGVNAELFAGSTALVADGSGFLKVNVAAGSSGNAAASATGSAVPADADYIGFNSGGNLVGVSSSNQLPVVASIASAQTLATVTSITNAVKVEGNAGGVFDAAQNSTPPANAIQISGIAATALPAAATATDTVVPMADKFGRQVVLPQTVRDLVGTKWTQIASSSAETTILGSVSSVFLDITGFQITNQSSTAVTVTIKDSTAGTTRKTYDLAANGGIVVHFSPPLPQAAVTNNWTATLSINTVTVDFNIDYVQNK